MIKKKGNWKPSPNPSLRKDHYTLKKKKSSITVPITTITKCATFRIRHLLPSKEIEYHFISLIVYCFQNLKHCDFINFGWFSKHIRQLLLKPKGTVACWDQLGFQKWLSLPTPSLSSYNWDQTIGHAFKCSGVGPLKVSLESLSCS